ncbi:MAG: hypothetical protein IIB00_03975 [candidate division Zixibacteria bacterium]|nr:hypothetical protein [candidate division Zixibacteria bacterium]
MKKAIRYLIIQFVVYFVVLATVGSNIAQTPPTSFAPPISPPFGFSWSSPPSLVLDRFQMKLLPVAVNGDWGDEWRSMDIDSISESTDLTKRHFGVLYFSPLKDETPLGTFGGEPIDGGMGIQFVGGPLLGGQDTLSLNWVWLSFKNIDVSDKLLAMMVKYGSPDTSFIEQNRELPYFGFTVLEYYRWNDSSGNSVTIKSQVVGNGTGSDYRFSTEVSWSFHLSELISKRIKLETKVSKTKSILDDL